MGTTMNRMEGNSSDHMGDLRDKVQAASDKVGPAIADAAKHASEAAGQIGEAANNVAACARTGFKNTSELVQEWPLASVLIAAATGFILARIFRS
jgi:ElaB/YqjD/DUF883 family membrane-anchored ribosome-binding protein